MGSYVLASTSIGAAAVEPTLFIFTTQQLLSIEGRIQIHHSHSTATTTYGERALTSRETAEAGRKAGGRHRQRVRVSWLEISWGLPQREGRGTVEGQRGDCGDYGEKAEARRGRRQPRKKETRPFFMPSKPYLRGQGIHKLTPCGRFTATRRRSRTKADALRQNLRRLNALAGKNALLRKRRLENHAVYRYL